MRSLGPCTDCCTGGACSFTGACFLAFFFFTGVPSFQLTPARSCHAFITAGLSPGSMPLTLAIRSQSLSVSLLLQSVQMILPSLSLIWILKLGFLSGRNGEQIFTDLEPPSSLPIAAESGRPKALHNATPGSALLNSSASITFSLRSVPRRASKVRATPHHRASIPRLASDDG